MQLAQWLTFPFFFSWQALPPLPSSNPPGTPPMPFPPGSFTPSTTSLNATLVRGRTDTTNLVPGFSDIPDASVKLAQQMQDGQGSVPPHYKLSVPTPGPPSQAYDVLRTNRRSTSGTLPPPSSRRDIYASEFDDLRSPKRTSHSMKVLDYSYVETEPKCVLLSPTEDKYAVGLGEVRHQSDRKQPVPPGSPTIISSDYSEALSEGKRRWHLLIPQPRESNK